MVSRFLLPTGRFLSALGFLVFLFVVYSNGYGALQPEPRDVHYLEVTGNKQVPFQWYRTEQKDGTVLIKLVEGQRIFKNKCLASGETISWEYINGETEKITAWREDDVLHVLGSKNGTPVEFKKEIDSRPWFQSLSYSLKNFVKSEDEKISFWTIRANTLDIYAMEARKKERKEIETVGGSELAQVVEIRVKGFLSKFWHCTYWYRIKDGFFLRYQATHGPVGTKQTTVNVTSSS